MGQSTEDFHLNNSNMKMFVVLALAALAAAEPEADPQLLFGGIHGVHTPYTHVAPVSTYSSPLLRTLVNPVKAIIPAVRTVVPEVKTALSTPLGKALGEPSYVAKNGEVVHEVRREKLKPLFSTPDSPTPPPHTTLVRSAPSATLTPLSTPSTITMVSQLSPTDPHSSEV